MNSYAPTWIILLISVVLLATSCQKETIDLPTTPVDEVLTFRFKYSDHHPYLLEDPTESRYSLPASYFCYGNGYMVIYSALKFDHSYLEPVSDLPIDRWEVADYEGNTDHYQGFTSIKVWFETDIPRETFDFIFKVRLKTN
jgi:hypothetical protein